MNIQAMKALLGFAPVGFMTDESEARRERRVNTVLLAAFALSVLMTGPDVSAFAAPATGSLGYDVYNVVVTQLLSGPIGFVGGVVLIVWGASQVMKQWLVTVLCVIAGTVIIKAASIVESLGALAY